MEQRGFTLVELLVVILIMGVLLTIGTVSLRNSQIDSRDNERASDIENIGRNLETYYASNMGTYPATALASTESTAVTTLGNINMKSIRAPGVTTANTTFKVATNATITTAGVLPQPTIDQYVYQPIASDGTLCSTTTQECRTYNLYYRTERNNTVMQVRGKQQ